MATTTARHHPGYSLLFLVGFLACYGACQEVKLVQVSTKYIEVSWERGGHWFGVTDYNVTLVPDGANTCIKAVECSDVECSFNTYNACGFLEACTSTELTVTGGTYSHTVISTTAPEPVTNVSLWLDMGMNVAWDNPDMFSSPCFEHTVVRFTFNGETTTTQYLEEEEETKFLMCVGGIGQVEIWTEGGDGDSEVELHSLTYGGDDVVPAVVLKNCTAVGCTSILLEWDYNPVCPGAVGFVLDIDYNTTTLKPLSLSTTHYTMSNLKVDESYPSCIRLVDEEGTILYTDCISPSCHTPEEEVQSVDVFPVLGSEEETSIVIGASWEPSICQSTNFTYKASIALNPPYNVDTISTTTTTCNFTGLTQPGEYTVCVEVQHNDYSNKQVCNSSFSYPDSPNYIYARENYDGSYYAYWSSGGSFYVDFYKVSWGQNQEYYNYTEYSSYTIIGYDHVDCVCVSYVWNNVTGQRLCTYDVTQNKKATDRNITGLIVGCVLAGLVVVAAVVGGLAFYVNKQNKRPRDSNQELTKI